MVLASPLLRRATEALYLLKNGSLTGSYIYRLWKASIQYYIYELYAPNMILSFFSLGSCPSKKYEKVAYMHTVALTDSAIRNVFLKSFENFKGLF